MGNKEMRTRADRFGGGSPAFPAQWFDGLCRALPGDRLFDTIAPGRREPPGNLTPALGASGPHGFAVRINAARLATPTRPPQPVPTSVTWPTSPLVGQDGSYQPVICVEKIREYFFVWGWTGRANHVHSLWDGRKHSAEHNPSRRAPDSARALPGERAPQDDAAIELRSPDSGLRLAAPTDDNLASPRLHSAV